jgi:hypothetical protein
MDMMDSALTAVPARSAAARPPIVRLVAGYGAIAACLPYLTLKIAWLAGSPLGTVGRGTAEMLDARHVVGNVVTVGMDLVAIVVALGFTYAWGQRVPAWLVLFPIWVGTGLLAPIALGMPLGVGVQAIAGGSPIAADNGLRGWVYTIVYTGFTGQAVLLLAAFVLYARIRWAPVFLARTRDLAAIPPARRLLANASTVVATGYGMTLMVWAVSGGDPATASTVAQKTFWATQGLLCVVGAVGLLALTNRWGRGVLLPLIATWVGTGVMVATGLYAALVDTGGSKARLVVLLLGVLTGLLMVTSARKAICQGRGRRFLATFPGHDDDDRAE